MKKKSAKHHARRKTAAKSAPVSSGRVSPIKRKLMAMRDDLVKTVQKQQISDDSTEAGDPADEASRSIEKEILFELSDVERNTLDQIEAALRKIDKGSYGACESCLKPIAKPRLHALPFARYCISCQSKSERAPEMVESVAELRGLSEET